MMLGVRRAGSRSLISYAHGTLTILDRKGLEATSCKCYRVLQDRFDRLSVVG
jgi:hypothetical protein